MKLPIFNSASRPKPAQDRSPGSNDLPPIFESADAALTPPAISGDQDAAGNDSAAFNPTGLEPIQVESSALDQLRQPALNRLLPVAVVLGAGVYIASLVRHLQTATPALTSLQWAGLVLFSLIWVALIVATFRRRMAYTRRTTLLVLALFVTGLATLLTTRLAGSGSVILFAVPWIAATLTGRRGRIASLALSISALILIAALALSGSIPTTGPNAGAGMDLLSWIIAILNFSLLAIAGVTSFGGLVDGLQDHLARQRALTSELESERTHLEARVAERADDLHRRLVQIRTAAEINRAISRVLDIGQLLPQVCELVRQRFDLYYVGVFLIEQAQGRAFITPEGDHSPSSAPSPETAQPANTTFAVLKAGSGEAGRKMLAEGHRLAVGGDSMIGWATANRQPRISQNVSHEGGLNVIARFNNPHLPLTRSELALPIQISEAKFDDENLPGTGTDIRVLGAMTIQSALERAFDQDDIVILQGIADGLASAIENARLFEATQASLDEIRTLHRQYLEQAWQLETALRGEIAYSFENEIRKPAGTNTASIEQTGEQRLEMPIRLRDQVIGSLTLEPATADDAHHAWTAEDLALVEAITGQAALALENARLLEETRRKVNLEHTAANITSRLWATADIETILRTALQELGSSLGARHGSIELWPAETRPGDGQPSGERVAGVKQGAREALDASD